MHMKEARIANGGRRMSKPAAKAAAKPAKIIVTLDVRNTGKVAGAEVVQLYLGLPSSPDAPQPPRQLKGFDKLLLKPGESRSVRFIVDASALSYWAVGSHAWKIAPGTYGVFVGSSSRDIRLHGSVRVR